MTTIISGRYIIELFVFSRGKRDRSRLSQEFVETCSWSTVMENPPVFSKKNIKEEEEEEEEEELQKRAIKEVFRDFTSYQFVTIKPHTRTRILFQSLNNFYLLLLFLLLLILWVATPF